MTTPPDRHLKPRADRAPQKLAVALGAAALLSLTLLPNARADDDALSLSDAWLRTIVPSVPAAGYFRLKNDGATARKLTGASSPACNKLMLHQSKKLNGVDKMVMVDKAVVPAHGALIFAPGGYHLMCMKPSSAMQPGQQVSVTLHFEDGAALTGMFKVHGVRAK